MKRRASLALAVAALAVAPLALRAANPTIVVSSAADAHDANPGDGVCETASGNGICTLRAAIEEANALAGADTIMFSSSLPSPTIFSVSFGSLPVSTDVAITGRGAGSTIIDGSGLTSGIFSISGPSTVTISGVTIQNGVNTSGLRRGGAISVAATLNLSDVVIAHNSADSGGGIFVSGGNVTLTHCTVINNSATSTDTGHGGGGIYSTGTLMLISSTIQSNSSQREGAGIYSTGALTVTSSTISANPAQLDGGGLYSLGTATITSSTIDGNSSQAGGGGIFAAAAITLQNVTVSRNLANASGGGLLLVASSESNVINSTVTQNQSGGPGGGILASSAATIHAYNATITSNKAGVSEMGGGVYLSASGSSIENTVLALNYRMSKSGNVLTDCGGTLMSLDYNLVQTLTDCTITGAAAHNVYGTDPNLGPLQDNGGPTLTSALLTGSPAIDTGNPSGCADNVGATLTSDQRGFPRPINGRCDMGAYEFGSVPRGFFGLTPCRLVDTRGTSGPLGGPALAALSTRDFVLVGTCGIPASAKAVSINVTVTQPTAAGDLRLFTGGASLPLVSTINYRALQTRANNAIVTLGASGDIDVRSDQPSGTVQFIVDINGYFQ